MRHPATCATSAALAAALSLAASPAQAEPLEIRVDELVGAGCSEGVAPLRVRVDSDLPRPVAGQVFLSEPYAIDRPRARVELTVPARGSAEVILYAGASWCSSTVCFEGGDRRECVLLADELGSASRPQAEILLLQRRLDFRPALSTVGGSVGGAPPPVSQARLEGPQGIPVLPDRAVGYGQIRMVFAEVSLLDQLGEAERRALGRWVRTGGEIALFAESADELVGSDFVRVELGGLVRRPGPATALLSPGLGAVHLAPVAEGASTPFDYDGEGLEATLYGSRRRTGLGLAHFVLVDPSAPAADGGAEESSTVAVSELAGYPERYRSSGWEAARWASDPLDSILGPASVYVGQYAGEAEDFGLDPNRTDRPPVWAYLLVVALAIAATFLLVRRWAARREAPVSRLLGATALVAVAGSLLLFGMGAAVRGLGSRYRSMAWIEAAEGAREGVAIRLVGVLFDRPGSAALPGEPGLLALGREARLERGDGGEELVLEGRRWETHFVSEHGVVDLGGAVDVERDGEGRIVAVRNGTRHAIEGAALVLGDRTASLGDLAPGERARVSDGGGAAHPDVVFAPRLLPDHAFRPGPWPPRFAGSVVGRLDAGCPRRGDFRGDRCSTTLVVRVTP